MTRDEIRGLIGGYATGSLSEAERRTLFEAALDDQELFDELAREQALKEPAGGAGREAASNRGAYSGAEAVVEGGGLGLDRGGLRRCRRDYRHCADAAWAGAALIARVELPALPCSARQSLSQWLPPRAGYRARPEVCPKAPAARNAPEPDCRASRTGCTSALAGASGPCPRCAASSPLRLRRLRRLYKDSWLRPPPVPDDSAAEPSADDSRFRHRHGGGIIAENGKPHLPLQHSRQKAAFASPPTPLWSREQLRREEEVPDAADVVAARPRYWRPTRGSLGGAGALRLRLQTYSPGRSTNRTNQRRIPDGGGQRCRAVLHDTIPRPGCCGRIGQ